MQPKLRIREPRPGLSSNPPSWQRASQMSTSSGVEKKGGRRPRDILRLVQGGYVARIFICLALAILVLGLPGQLQAQSRAGSLDKKLDELFSGVTSPDSPGLAVLV